MNAFQNQKSENQFLSESLRWLILAINQLTCAVWEHSMNWTSVLPRQVLVHAPSQFF